MDVVLLRWPAERAQRERLRELGRPRLLLVEADAPAPVSEECLEDWLRVPAPEADVAARAAALLARSRSHGGTPPTLDDDGVLRHGDHWVPLPPVEARLARPLLDRLGTVVSREALTQAGWPDGTPGRNALDVHMLRLRRRLPPVHLVVRTIRSRGYLLEPAPSDCGQETVAQA